MAGSTRLLGKGCMTTRTACHGQMALMVAAPATQTHPIVTSGAVRYSLITFLPLTPGFQALEVMAREVLALMLMTQSLGNRQNLAPMRHSNPGLASHTYLRRTVCSTCLRMEQNCRGRIFFQAK